MWQEIKMKTAAIEKDSKFWALTIGAIGVVYGDIGTSPIYAFREALRVLTESGQAPALQEVLGLLSLIIWALLVLVTVKYVIILLRIDNKGEGGTLALMALARSVAYRNTKSFLFLGMAGAALFYGDAILTPALSVLSAVEGVEIISPAFKSYVIPITLGIIIGLFLFQSKGTGKVSALFGPVTAVWFAALAYTGLLHISDEPRVLMAFNPWYAFSFLVEHGKISFLALGAVFLAVTGAEALYADLGHFGKKPIQLAWFWFVFPALAINYLGQGALVLHDPSTADNPFFKMAPDGWLVPMVVLATLATIIASQAVITGAYSMTQQAVSLGLLPRLEIRHTSEKHSGQIYMPQVNNLMLLGVIFLVLVFKSSGALAVAYGISVTGTMVITAIMAFFVIWQVWGWSLPKTVLLIAPFLLVEGIFLSANLIKVTEGGWMPLVLAAVLVMMMGTWVQGTFILNGRARKRDMKLDKFVQEYDTRYPDLKRVSGSAFFFVADPTFVPSALMMNIRHNKALHEKNIILSIKTESVPFVDPQERRQVTDLGNDFSLVVFRFGFKELPDVQAELMKLNRDASVSVKFDWEDTSIFLSRRSIRSDPDYGLPLWQDAIYIFLNRYASEPTDFYKLPVGRVIELGKHVVI